MAATTELVTLVTFAYRPAYGVRPTSMPQPIRFHLSMELAAPLEVLRAECTGDGERRLNSFPASRGRILAGIVRFPSTLRPGDFQSCLIASHSSQTADSQE